MGLWSSGYYGGKLLRTSSYFLLDHKFNLIIPSPEIFLLLSPALYHSHHPRWWHDFATFRFIDRMHKWRPKKYSFVVVLIRLTSLISTDKIQKKCSFRTRLVGLISTKTKECFVGYHLCIQSISCQNKPALHVECKHWSKHQKKNFVVKLLAARHYVL